MPAPKKPPGKRVDNRQSRQGIGQLMALPGGAMETPPPREEWEDAMKLEWAAYWNSPVSQAVEAGSALGALMRLFDLKDRVLRFEQGARGNELTLGSTKQPQLNPLLKEAHLLNAEIRQLEDRFGMSPKACVQLGVAITGAQRTLEEMNKSLAPADKNEVIEAEEVDPRSA